MKPLSTTKATEQTQIERSADEMARRIVELALESKNVNEVVRLSEALVKLSAINQKLWPLSQILQK